MKLTKRYPTIIDGQGHRHEPLLTYDNPLPNDLGTSKASHTSARCVRLPVLFDQWLVGKDITIADHQDQQYELPHDIIYRNTSMNSSNPILHQIYTIN